MAIAWAGAGTLLSTSNNNNPYIVDMPDSVAEGDFLLALFAGDAGWDRVTWSATGWTLLPVSVGANPASPEGAVSFPIRFCALYRVAGPAEPASVSFTKTAGISGVKAIIHRFTGVDPVTPLDVSQGHQRYPVPPATVDFDAMTSVTDGALSVIAAHAATTPTIPSGYTQESLVSSGSPRIAIFDQTIATAGTVDPPSFSGTTTSASKTGFHFLLRPADAGPPPATAQRPYAVLVM